MQILVVEDDKRISSFLVKGLEEQGYLVTLCASAEDFLENYSNLEWDLIILDVMLPGMDGLQLVQTLRYKKKYVPILMLSALNAVQDKVSALDYGADDYLTKPFHFEELISRIKALTRRQQYQQQQKDNSVEQVFGSLRINLDKYEVTLDGNLVDLSPREYKLLVYLIKNVDKPVSRFQILNAVWGINFDNHSNVVDVYISYLRNKLDKGDEKYIHTVKGVGYVFKLQL